MFVDRSETFLVSSFPDNLASQFTCWPRQGQSCRLQKHFDQGWVRHEIRQVFPYKSRTLRMVKIGETEISYYYL